LHQRNLFLLEEIQAGRLWQGWGYKPEHNLENPEADDGLRRNMRMLQVKEGDYIIVPRLPRWDDVCILVATEDGILDINLKYLR
jgi:hypothetical protein